MIWKKNLIQLLTPMFEFNINSPTHSLYTKMEKKFYKITMAVQKKKSWYIDLWIHWCENLQQILRVLQLQNNILFFEIGASATNFMKIKSPNWLLNVSILICKIFFQLCIDCRIQFINKHPLYFPFRFFF